MNTWAISMPREGCCLEQVIAGFLWLLNLKYLADVKTTSHHLCERLNTWEPAASRLMSYSIWTLLESEKEDTADAIIKASSDHSGG